MSEKRALIIGSGGQDGRLLTAYLSSQNYRVVGMERTRVTGLNTRKPAIALDDRDAIASLVEEIAPQEIYYLAAFDHSSSEAPGDRDALFVASKALQELDRIALDAAERKRRRILTGLEQRAQ